MRLPFRNPRSLVSVFLSLNVALVILGSVPSHARAFTVNPTSVAFGNVKVGTSQSLTETLTNVGAESVTVSTATTSGKGFSASGLTMPLTLPGGHSYTFTLTFAPLSSGSTTGKIVFSSPNWISSVTVPLTGTGTTAGQLTVSPASLSFGNVTVGGSASLGGTLTASGANVTVTSATSSSSEFLLTGLSFPLTVTAGKSASFTVKFTPQTSGIASGTLSFASNATSSPTESLTGTGVAPSQHSVALSWSETSVVVGYNVYRGTASGGPYSKINSALDASPSYTDVTVLAGKTYYYVATAVDSGGTESVYSTQVRAVIPFP